MKILFKKISKDLIDEGITIDLLNNIQSLTVNLPAMIEKGDEPINVIKANDKEYWVVFPDHSYLKDEKGNPITIPAKKVIIGKARCYLCCKEELIKKQVDSEIKAIKSELTKIVMEAAKNFNRIYLAAFGTFYFDVFYTNFDFQKHQIINAIELSNGNPMNQENAKKFLEENPDYQEYVEYIYNLLKKEDFDTLFILFKTKGLPELFRVKSNNSKDLDVLKQFFHKDKIEDTAKLLSNNSHLYNAVLFKVSRLYSVA